jgi:hypothetical protein
VEGISMFGLHNDAIARRHERHGRQSDASLEALAACVLSGSYVGERTTIRRRVHSSTKFRTAFARARLPPTGAIFVGNALGAVRIGVALIITDPRLFAGPAARRRRALLPLPGATKRGPLPEAAVRRSRSGCGPASMIPLAKCGSPSSAIACR